MFIKGSSTAARELSSDLVTELRTIAALTNDIGQDLRQLQATFQDEGFEDMNQIVTAVAKATIEAAEPISAVCKKLNRYAEILDQA